MRKKVLATLLSLTMIFSLLPTWAMAEGEGTVAEVGTTEYDSFAEAFAGANTSGGTIDLLADAMDVEGPFNVTSDVTLNLNGHKLCAVNKAGGDAAAHSLFTVKANATLTINGAGGTVEGGIVVGTASDNNAALVLDGGTYISQTYGDSAYAVVQTNGKATGCSITVEDAVLTGGDEGIAVYAASGAVTLKNSKITAGSPVYVKSGTTSIESCTLTGKMEREEYQYSGNGAYATGEALVVDACGYPGSAPVVTVSGANVFSGKTSTVGEYETGKEPATISITGGTFSDFSALDYLADDANVTIKLLNDVTLSAPVDIAGKVTLNLNGRTVDAVSSGFINKNRGLFCVLHGGDLTVENTTGNGTIDATTGGVYAGILMTTKDEPANANANAAKLTVNGGTIKGVYYGISGNGNDGRDNTEITINGGKVMGTANNDNTGIYHPQYGTLTINGGIIEGASGIYVKSGAVTTTIGAGEIIGNGAWAAFNHSGNGFNNTGDAFVVENCGYPGGAPVPAIEGGIFTSTNGNAVASYSYGEYQPITGFITGGTFNTTLDETLLAKDYTQLDSGKVVEQLAGGITVTGDEDELTPGEKAAAETAIDEIKAQLDDEGAVAIANADAVAEVDGVDTLEVTQTAMVMTTTGEGSTAAPAVKSITFDVTPKDDSGKAMAELANDSKITFQLPVPDAWEGRDVKVAHTHEGEETVNFAKVQSTNGSHYVSVTSGKFSYYSLTALTEEELEEALAETDYGVMVEYNDGSVTYYIYSEDPNEDELYDAIVDAIDHNATLVLLADEVFVYDYEAVNTYIAELESFEPFKVELNGHEFTYFWDYEGDEIAPYTIVDAPTARTITLTPDKTGDYHVGDSVTVTPTVSAGGYDGVSLKVTYDSEYLKFTGTGDDWKETTTAGEVRFFDYDGVTGTTLPALTFEVIKADPTQTSIKKYVNVTDSQYVVGMSSTEPYSFVATDATISIASIEVTLPEAKTAVYSGDSIPSNTLTGIGYTVSYSGSEAASYNAGTGKLSATDAGDYTVTLTLKDYEHGKYKWPAAAAGTDGFTKNDDGTATYTVLTITQAENQITIVTVSDDNKVDFTEDYTLDVTADWGAETATFEYATWNGTVAPTSDEGITWEAGAPTSAGTYAVKATIPACSNWAGAVGYGVFEIEKGALTITAPTKTADVTFTEEVRNNGYALINAGSIQYGETLAEGSEYGTFYYYCGAAAPVADPEPGVVPTANAARDYKVWYKFVPGGNYELSEGSEVEADTWNDLGTVKIRQGKLDQTWFTVTKKDNQPANGTAVSVLTDVASQNLSAPTALSTAFKYAVTPVTEAEAPTTGWETNYSDVKVAETGKYNIWIQVTDDDSNYEIASFNMGTFELTQGEYTAFLIKAYLEGNPLATKAKDKPSKDLILVFAKDDLGFKYGTTAMVDVTGMDYDFATIKGRVTNEPTVVSMSGKTDTEGSEYTQVYAYLVSGNTTTGGSAGSLDEVKMTGANVKFNTLSTFRDNPYDVNGNGSINVDDASAVYNIYKNKTAATTLLAKALLADTNRDGKIDLTGADEIRQWFLFGDGPVAAFVN